MPIRIVIADDRAALDSLAAAIGAATDLEVVGRASDGAEALALTAALMPDALVLGPRQADLDVASTLRERMPWVRVVALAPGEPPVPALRRALSAP